MTDTNTQPAALAIRATLTSSGASAAERQLVVLGDQSGDTQLALVVQDLLPGDIAAVVSVGDYTKPSIAVHFMKPEQFIGALERLGGQWGDVNAETKLEPITGQLEDFVVSSLLSTEGDQQAALLRAFLDHELGEAIVVLLCGRGALQVVQDDEWAIAAEKGNWQELLALIQQEHNASYRSIVATLTSLSSRGDEEEEEGNRAAKKHDSHTVRTLRRLVKLASEHVKATSSGEKTQQEEIFGGI
jgi:hypothetical protein